MPKYRQLHTKVIDSFDFNEMPDDFTRVVWLLLTLILDSEGRGIDNPSWIKSKMFPLRTDIDNQKIEESFNWFSKHKMIVRYSKDKHNYFYIPTFKLYQSGTQKEALSVLPAPDKLKTYSGEEKEEVGAAASASESASESALESESEFKEVTPTSPSDWIPKISQTQLLVEKIAMILPPQIPGDIVACEQIERMNPTQLDIQAAVDYLHGEGMTNISHWKSLVNPIKISMSQRLKQTVPKQTTLDKSKAAVDEAIRRHREAENGNI